MPTLKEISDALDVLCFACDELPEDWQLSLEFRKGELSIVLDDPETGEDVEICTDDLCGAELFATCVDHARTADGLQPTGLLEL